MKFFFPFLCLDRDIALKYVNVIRNLTLNDTLVKRNRNIFFKYFLKVLEEQLNAEVRLRIQCQCPIENEVGYKHLKAHFAKKKKTFRKQFKTLP